jgi:SPP1 gp7 family putative phage head morphogenesis protein
VIFRNATMGAYASGRDKQMSQPAVLKARPYWQILGVDDARTRDPHRKAHGKVLRADDPFWKRCALPWGHACRCRKVSRSEADLKRLGLTVVDGSSISGLPDPGWSSSLSLL